MVACLFVLLLVGADPEPSGPPTGPPPRLEVVSVRDGRIVQGPTVYKSVYSTDYRQELRGGHRVVVPFTVKRLVPLTKPAYTIIKARFRTVGGEKLDADEAKRRIGAGKLVVIAADHKPVDAKWLKVLKPDTLVVIPEPGGIVESE